MQPLGDTQRLPRLLSRARPDGLGGLRPGRERVATSNSEAIARPAGMAGQAPDRRPSRRRPYGWLIMTVTAGAVISLFHLPAPTQGKLLAWADTIAVRSGLAVDHVAVIGHENTTMDEIVAALDLDADKSLLGFNGADVRRKLQRLPWVNSVRVVHILPDTLSIEISERTPSAIWQHEGRYYLVDRNGHTLARYTGAVPQDRLPVVVGTGAGLKAGPFLDVIARHPKIARQLAASVRVADRRWNLVLKSGKKILLPEHGVRGALATLEALFERKTLRGSDVAEIDLRIPARPTLRLAKRTGRALRERKEARRAAAILLSRGAS